MIKVFVKIIRLQLKRIIFEMETRKDKWHKRKKASGYSKRNILASRLRLGQMTPHSRAPPHFFWTNLISIINILTVSHSAQCLAWKSIWYNLISYLVILKNPKNCIQSKTFFSFNFFMSGDKQ